MTLSIRAPRLDDAHALLEFELANRAYFESWINGRDPSFYSLAGVTAALEQAQAAREDDSGHQFLVFEDDRLVGRVNLAHVRRAPFDSAELGYRVGEREGGRGVASRAVALCLAQAFGPLALWRVQATARVGNLASVRVLERSGFTRFGRSQRCVRFQGQWHDLLYFERHREPTEAADAPSERAV